MLILTQAREDPDTYDSATFPPIYGLSRDDYIHQFTWTSPTLSLVATDQIEVPLLKDITIAGEHFDVGKKNLVLLAPVDCGSSHNTSTISGPSAHFYNFANKAWTCRDLDSTYAPMDLSTSAYWEHTP